MEHFPLYLTLALAGVAAAGLEPLSKSYVGPRAANKPYTSFEQFFPFYLTEHADETNRKLHVVGTTCVILLALMRPTVILGLVGGGSIGFVLCQVFAGYPHGFFEFGAVIAYYLLFCHLNDCFAWALVTLVVGYSFAWVGHFVFQKNRPATFTYPVYSLMGDFKMWSQEFPRLVNSLINNAKAGGAGGNTVPAVGAAGAPASASSAASSVKKAL